MFKQFTRKTRHNEEKPCVINTEKVISITELHTEPTTLYNELGEVVETRETPKVFEITLENSIKFRVDENTYNSLVADLVK